MINPTYNNRKQSLYNNRLYVNEIESRCKQNFEAIRKTDAFKITENKHDKLNLIIDIPDRW